MRSELTRSVSVCLLSIVLLSCGFQSNCWQVAEQGWFEGHQRDSESLVLGRLVKSRQDGVFSAAGLTGTGVPIDLHEQWLTSEQVDSQYSAYLDGSTFDRYSPYLSQTGGQAMLFSVLDRLVPLSPRAKLTSFHLLTSLLSATALALVILWFYRELGGWVAGLVGTSVLLSQWMTVFGRNLWWSLWAFYLPMIVVMHVARSRRRATNRYLVTLGSVVFGSMLVKCLVNGYEYITATLVMMLTPLVYYGFRDRVTSRHALKETLVALSCAGGAIGFSLVILIGQIAAVKGGLFEGYEHIAFSLAKRTYGEAGKFPAEYAASLDAGTVEVVARYLKGTFFDVNNFVATSPSWIARVVFKIRYFYLIVLFGSMSALVWFRRDPHLSAERRHSHVALIAACWFSILGPLSWFVIFKAHSHIHTRMNFILWQMPFTLFGFAVSGLVVQRVVAALSRRRRRSPD